MMNDADKQIGRLVLERGLVSREALQQAGGAVMSRRQAGQPAEVLGVLVELGALSREHAAALWQEVHGGLPGAPSAHPINPQSDSTFIRPPGADLLGGFGAGPPIPHTIDPSTMGGLGSGPPIPHTIDPSTMGAGPPIPHTIDPSTMGGLGSGPPIPHTIDPSTMGGPPRGGPPLGGFGGGGGGDFSPVGESFGAPAPPPGIGGFGAVPGSGGFGAAPGSGFVAGGTDPLAAMSPSASTSPGSGPAAPVKKPVSSRRLQRTASGRAVSAPKKKKGVSGKSSRPSGRTSPTAGGGGGGGLGLIAGSLIVALGLVGGAAWYVHSKKAGGVAQTDPVSEDPTATPTPSDGSPPPSSPTPVASGSPRPTASASPRPTQRPSPTPKAPDGPLTIDTPERLVIRSDMSQDEINALSEEWADELIGKATDLKLDDNLKDAVRVLKLYPKELPNTPGERRAKAKLAEYEACLGFVQQLQDALDEGPQSEQLVRLIKRIEGGELSEDMAELRAVEVFVNRARELIGGERYDQLAFEAQKFDENN